MPFVVFFETIRLRFLETSHSDADTTTRAQVATSPNFPAPAAYGVGCGAVEPPGSGEGASDAEPSVFDGFRFATALLL
jgi:hypothetical protein